MAKAPTTEERLADFIGETYADPLAHVMRVYPWDMDSSIQQVRLPEKWRARFPRCEYGPDVWACELLDDIGREVKARGFTGQGSVNPIQFATVSGHGIGKSTCAAWIVKWIMDTRPFCHGTVTANTADQLRTKTWAEIGKWNSLSLTSHWFDYRSARGSMSLRHKLFPDRWFCNAVTCREENSEAFAGQHAAGSTSFYLFDEASAVPTKIYEVRSGGLTDGEPMVFDFGNGTRNSGEFYEECEGRIRQRFNVRSIDSRDVAITNKSYIDQLIKDYGEDSDRVRVRVKGQFPAGGSVEFIGTGDVEDAMRRELVPDRHAPLLIGVDVARFGDDDSVIWPRVGNDARSWPPRRFQGLDTVQTVGKVIECLAEFRAMGMRCAGLFVDGGGVGGGVVDQLRHLGHNPIEVQFGGSPTDKQTYRYRSDEMWGRMKQAIKDRLCLPSNDEDVKSELTAREYGFTGKGQIHLETKREMKERGVGSPDLADALALTFAAEVAPTTIFASDAPAASAVHEYDPHGATW